MKTVVKQAPSGAYIEFTPFTSTLIENIAEAYEQSGGKMETRVMFEAMRGLVKSINGKETTSNTITINTSEKIGKELAKQIPFTDLIWLAVESRLLTYPNEPIKISMNWQVGNETIKKEHSFLIDREGLGIISSKKADEVAKQGYDVFYKPYHVILPYSEMEVICYPPTVEFEDETVKKMPKKRHALADFVSRKLKFKDKKGHLQEWDWDENPMEIPNLGVLRQAFKDNEGYIDTRVSLKSPDGLSEQITNFIASPDFFRMDTIL